MVTRETHVEIHLPDTSSQMPLPFAEGGIRAGFPSPAQDYISESIDLNTELIAHPAATFYGRVIGDSMSGEGIEEGDILVIDKSLEPANGDLAVCQVDGEFTLKRLNIQKDRVLLMPSSPNYQPIVVTVENQFMIWGIVTYTIKRNRRPR
ncbi:MAG: translesion error-prone DNA polymerase V autoproteolytic subunit [Muribaculaceae bacterium]|nr:translesion error-prone DNA polymerase V autoproteolytic subunit [Muribaculaceae bacterium]